MRIETWPLTGASAGTRRELTLYRFGVAGAGPKVYLQAGLHAEEMPGVLVLQRLLDLLDEISARGGIVGEICIVPLANPIGMSQWIHQRPLGRHDTESLQNFNRGYPDLMRLVSDGLDGVLGADEAENRRLIRRAFRKALAELAPRSEVQELQAGLLSLACDADYVLDLHCDHFAVMHLYAPSALPNVTQALCRTIGAKLALISDEMGGTAFDEALNLPWRQLQARYPHVPTGCYAATLEYRGQFDVEDGLATEDAERLMTFLASVGAIRGWQDTSSHPDALHRPLAGAMELFAPQGGVVTWSASPGDMVEAGQVVAHVTDPVCRRRLPVTAPVSGMLFRCELWRSCLRGRSLGHVAGEVPLRSGLLLPP